MAKKPAAKADKPHVYQIVATGPVLVTHHGRGEKGKVHVVGGGTLCMAKGKDVVIVTVRNPNDL